ncbi:MAG: hypothetical protein LBL86_08240 [Coriobacteriales bacterium]|nr:hypothetical protein [Coriobacteriales bacterium]
MAKSHNFVMSLILGIVIILGLLTGLFGVSEAHPNDIYIHEVVAENDGNVRVIGDMLSSGMAYNAYSVEQNGNVVLLHIKSAPVTPFNRDGSFDIVIEDAGATGIEEIILVGRGASKTIYRA